MDITPQVINEVAFHKARRGYDPAEVDDFLDAVAAAFDDLHHRVRELETRAEAADRRANDAEARVRELAEAPPAASAPPVTDGVSPVTQADLDEKMESVQKTLVIAQQTADTVVRQARDESATIKATAEGQAEQLLADTRAEAQRMHEQAEVDARRHGEGTRQRLIEEVIALEEIRDGYKSDVSLLDRHVAEQRLRVAAAVSELHRALEDKLQQVAVPELSDGTREQAALPSPPLALENPATPPAPDAADPATETDVDDAEDLDDDDEPAVDAAVDAAADSEAAGVEPPAAVPPAAPVPPEATELRPPPPAAATGAADPVAARQAERAREEDAWSRFVADDEAIPTFSTEATQSVDMTGVISGSQPVIDIAAADRFLGDERTEDGHHSRFGRRR